MYKILLFVVLICIINALVFVFLDSDLFMLTKKAFNQPWRFLTFQFCHLNQMHLMENIIGFLLVGFIAAEINADLWKFSLAYFASVFVVIPFVFLLSSEGPVAGNSTGIYGALSMTLIESRKLVPIRITVPLFMLLIFSMSIVNFLRCGMCFERYFESEFYHFIGFVSGAVVSSVSIKKRKYILRVKK
ncbi:MAG TPA: rhomboid family intramembrane serine protease [Candidatus Altiarchaeales archaeon]|nr:rhomboid family intramembrane serine protease [Candidatus Altiarchaeales archaeon]